jgi:hypothetical protein
MRVFVGARGNGALPEYRHYRLDGAGKISKADWIEAGSDDEAVRQVRASRLGVTSELWRGNRLVARVEPGEADES